MNPPKLPQGIFFADGDGLKISQEEGWRKLENPREPLEVKLLVRGGIRRKYIPGRGSEPPTRVFCGNSIENFMHLPHDFEEMLLEFLKEAFRWAKDRRHKKTQSPVSRVSASRKARPKEPQKSLGFRSALPRPR